MMAELRDAEKAVWRALHWAGQRVWPRVDWKDEKKVYQQAAGKAEQKVDTQVQWWVYY